MILITEEVLAQAFPGSKGVVKRCSRCRWSFRDLRSPPHDDPAVLCSACRSIVAQGLPER